MFVALEVNGLRRNIQTLLLFAGEVHAHKHLSFQQTLWVLDEPAHLDRARAGVEVIRKDFHLAVEGAAGISPRMEHQWLPWFQMRQVLLGRIKLNPKPPRISDYEKWREKLRRVRQHLVGPHFLPWIEVLFHYDTAQGTLQLVELIDRVRVAAIEQQPSQRAFLFGECSGVLRFRRLQILQGRGAVIVQFADAIQCPLGQQKIRGGFACVRLRLPVIRRTDPCERLILFNGLPGLSEYLKNASSKRRKDADGHVVIPDQAAVESEFRALAWRDDLCDKRCALWTVFGNFNAFAFDSSRRRLRF